MSAETLRRAAAELRHDWHEGWMDPENEETKFHLAVADWLEECADDYGKGYGTPDAHALAVARAYLGEDA